VGSLGQINHALTKIPFRLVSGSRNERYRQQVNDHENVMDVPGVVQCIHAAWML
jgi:hypothetical protein